MLSLTMVNNQLNISFFFFLFHALACFSGLPICCSGSKSLLDYLLLLNKLFILLSYSTWVVGLIIIRIMLCYCQLRSVYLIFNIILVWCDGTDLKPVLRILDKFIRITITCPNDISKLTSETIHDAIMMFFNLNVNGLDDVAIVTENRSLWLSNMGSTLMDKLQQIFLKLNYLTWNRQPTLN